MYSGFSCSASSSASTVLMCTQWSAAPRGPPSVFVCSGIPPAPVGLSRLSGRRQNNWSSVLNVRTVMNFTWWQEMSAKTKRLKKYLLPPNSFSFVSSFLSVVLLFVYINNVKSPRGWSSLQQNKPHIHPAWMAGGFGCIPPAATFVFHLHIIPISPHSHSRLHLPPPAPPV